MCFPSAPLVIYLAPYVGAYLGCNCVHVFMTYVQSPFPIGWGRGLVVVALRLSLLAKFCRGFLVDRITNICNLLAVAMTCVCVGSALIPTAAHVVTLGLMASLQVPFS